MQACLLTHAVHVVAAVPVHVFLSCQVCDTLPGHQCTVTRISICDTGSECKVKLVTRYMYVCMLLRR